MSVLAGQSLTADFTVVGSTGALVNADSTPTGTLVINGTDNAASVTVTNKTTGIYKAAVTVPTTVTLGDRVQIRIAATVSSVASGGYIFSDFVDSRITDILRLIFRAERVLFVSTNGNTSYDGLTPSTAKALPSQACSIATAGDVILVESGTYTQGTTSVVVPDDVQMIGAGWQRTIINSEVANPSSICKPGSRSLIDGFTFYGTLSTDVAQRGLGLGQSETTFTDAVVRNCRIFGNADGVQISKISASASIKFYDCIIESGFDAFATTLSSANTVDFYNCEFNADAALIGGYSLGGVTCRCIAVTNQSTINAYNCKYRATGASSTNSGVQTASSASAKVNVFGSVGFACDIYDLERSNGTINAYNTNHDSAKTSGTISYYGDGIAQGYDSTLATNTGTTNTTIAAATTLTASGVRSALGMAAADLDTKFSLVATAANLATLAGKFTGITSVTNWLKAMIRKSTPDATAASEIGGTYDATTDSLEGIKDSGVEVDEAAVATAVWGASSRTLSPMIHTTAQAPFVATRDLPAIPEASGPSFQWTITDSAGSAVNLSGKTVRFVVATVDTATDEYSRFDDTLVGEFQYQSGTAALVISGASNNVVTVQVHSDDTTAIGAGEHRYWMWDVTTAGAERVLVKGKFPVEPAVRAV